MQDMEQDSESETEIYIRRSDDEAVGDARTEERAEKEADTNENYNVNGIEVNSYLI